MAGFFGALAVEIENVLLWRARWQFPFKMWRRPEARLHPKNVQAGVKFSYQRDLTPFRFTMTGVDLVCSKPWKLWMQLP